MGTLENLKLAELRPAIERLRREKRFGQRQVEFNAGFLAGYEWAREHGRLETLKNVSALASNEVWIQLARSRFVEPETQGALQLADAMHSDSQQFPDPGAVWRAIGCDPSIQSKGQYLHGFVAGVEDLWRTIEPHL